MKQPKLNQRVKIWRHLLRHGSITQEVALARYGAARLAARIEARRGQRGPAARRPPRA